jgi:hypothetical protein
MLLSSLWSGLCQYYVEFSPSTRWIYVHDFTDVVCTLHFKLFFWKYLRKRKGTRYLKLGICGVFIYARFSKHNGWRPGEIKRRLDLVRTQKVRWYTAHDSGTEPVGNCTSPCVCRNVKDNHHFWIGFFVHRWNGFTDKSLDFVINRMSYINPNPEITNVILFWMCMHNMRIKVIIH